MRATDGFTDVLTSATGSSATFRLTGGIYLIAGVWTAQSGATVALQTMCADSVTFVSVASALTNNGKSAALYLPSGQYKFLYAGSFGTGEMINASVWRCPTE